MIFSAGQAPGVQGGNDSVLRRQNIIKSKLMNRGTVMKGIKLSTFLPVAMATAMLSAVPHRTLFVRADLAEPKVRTLRGVIGALVNGRGN
jgi:hypothetical protein